MTSSPNRKSANALQSRDRGTEVVDENEKTSVVARLQSLNPKRLVALYRSFLENYCRYASSASNQDKLLKVLQYSLLMIARFWLQKRGRRSGALTKLSGEINWARYILRFLGLPAALEAARSGSWAKSSVLGKAMAWSMILYYPLEYAAYLRWQAPGVLTTSPLYSDKGLAAKASALSCGFWAAYIVLDSARGMITLSNIQSDSKEGGVPEDDQERSRDHECRMERLQLVRNACFLLPSVHWSLPKWDTDPWLPADLVNVLMWLESVVCLGQSVVQQRYTNSLLVEGEDTKEKEE